jgi:hypothetical protein
VIERLRQISFTVRPIAAIMVGVLAATVLLCLVYR